MGSWAALRQCIGGRTKAVARKLRVSPSLVGKWQEPSHGTFSGCKNPVDRLEGCIVDALANGAPEEDAFAPLDYLNQRFDRAAIPISPPPVTEPEKELARDLARAAAEFGHFTSEASETIGITRISRQRLEKVAKEGWDLIKQTLRFMRRAEGIADGTR